MIPEDVFPDGPYRPAHWPAWARDEIITHVTVRFRWMDWLLVAIGRPVTVTVRTVVGVPVVGGFGLSSESSAWAHRIRWPWQKPEGGYAEVGEPR
jgi:hypothetical protein